jgi:hypothetical protein
LIITPDPSFEKDVARLFDAASGSGTRPGELRRYTSPYRGLAAMEEQDSAQRSCSSPTENGLRATLQTPQGFDATHRGELFPIDESCAALYSLSFATQEKPGLEGTGVEILVITAMVRLLVRVINSKES